IGGLSLFASAPSWGGGVPLVLTFVAALAVGERVWPVAFERQIVVAALLSSFTAVACLYTGGYLLPLFRDFLLLQGIIHLALPVAVLVCAAGALPAAAEPEVEQAGRIWMVAGAAGAVAFYVVLLLTR